MPLEQGVEIGGRYVLERSVGVGGMAAVWLARDRRLNRDVAVKLLSETLVAEAGFVERFEREAQLAAGLSHPNLVTVHDLGVDDDRPYLVMEHVQGETLGERLRDDPGSVSAGEVAETLLGALEHIHEAGIVHRDLKPANVLIGRDGRLRLTDFGIAQMADATSGITQTGQVLGTLRFMAPEVRRGERASARSDLYSLGVLLEDCMGDDEPAELRELVDYLRSQRPEARPASARESLGLLGAGPATRSTERLAGDGDPADPGRATEAYGPPTDEQPVDASEGREHEPLPPPSHARPPASVLPSTPPARPAGGETEVGRPPAGAARSGGPSSRRALALVGAGLVAAVVIAIVALSGSDSEPQSQSGSNGGGGQASAGAGNGGGGGSSTTTPPAVEEAPPADSGAEDAIPTPSSDPDPARGARLDRQGKALINSGEPERAVPVLRDAVASFPAGTTDENYAFALFNYGQALRLSGQPEQAIPVLEARLQINNQIPTVQAELDRARADAAS